MKESLEKKKNKNVKKGISLIVLVITIIVIVILAVAVILSIANNNPISNANKAKFQNDIKTMQEELELAKASNYAESNGERYTDKNGELTINSLKGYEDKFIVKNGELRFKDENLTEIEKEWAQEMGVIDFRTFTSVFGGDSKYFVSEDTIEGRNGENFKILKNGENNEYLKYGITENGLFVNLEFYSDPNSEIVRNGKDFSEVQYLEIPNEVKEIGKQSLWFIGAEEVKLPEGIKKLGDEAFSCSGNLKKINLPNSLEYIGETAFQACTSLEAIVIPEKIKTLEVGVFMGCSNLKKVEIKGQNLEEIKSGAFDATNISEIFIPKSVKSIESYSLSSYSLNKIIVENGSELNLSEDSIKAWGGFEEIVSIDTSSENTVITVKPYKPNC